MLGYGCHYRDRCSKYKKATSGWKSTYCENSRGYERCPELPSNYGNKEVQKAADNFEQGQGIGALIVLGVIIFGALKLFGVI